MRILAISSQVAYGPVGNSAAVPALQTMGHEVLAVPTIILSNHPGHGKPAGFRTAAADLAAILQRLVELGALRSCAAVMTGYFASPDQVQEVARVVERMKADNPALYVLVDPVIGDGDALYVALPVAEAIRDALVPLANCLTPNRFELEWLTGKTIATVTDAIAAARGLAVPKVLATSIPAGLDRLATLAVTSDSCAEHISPLKASVPHDTGDFLAGLYIGERLAAEPEQALRRSLNILQAAITRSGGSAALNVTSPLDLT